MQFFKSAWLRGVMYGTAVLWATACSSGGNGDDDDSTGCKAGTERCACKDGACDAGLECLSDVCVKDKNGGTGGAETGGAGGDTGGGPRGGSGANPTGGKGGSDTGGSAGVGGTNGGTSAGAGSDNGATGGDSGSDTGGTTGVGGDANGGTGGDGGMGAAAGSGGATGGSGGEGASGGMSGAAGMCTADVQTDPNNCGRCGKVCRYELWDRCNDACCQNGACLDGFGECFRESDGFASCDEYCSSIGEVCVPKGCGTSTYRGWATPDSCDAFAAGVGDSMGACDEQIQFDSATVRCCCTDTQ